MAVEFEVVDKIISVEKEGGYSIQLNKMKWGTNQPKYDLRIWRDDKPMKGFTLSDEELISLCEAMATLAGIAE